MTHLQLLALGIPYSGNTKLRCDPGFSIDRFYINKCNICYPFLPLLGVMSGVKIVIVCRIEPYMQFWSGTWWRTRQPVGLDVVPHYWYCFCFIKIVKSLTSVR